MTRLLHIVFFIFMFLGQYLIAQDNELYFKQMSVEDGLSQSWIMSIEQDAYGFMWFGSSDGLNRFNGYEFEVYTHNPKESSSIRNNYILALEEDRLNRMWVGTRLGLCRFNRKKNNFEAFDNWPSEMVNSIHAGEDKIYVGTIAGIYIYDLNSNIRDELLEQRINEFLKDSIIYALLGEGSLLWIGTNNGLYVLNTNTQQIRLVRAEEGKYSEFTNVTIRSLERDYKNRIWVGTQSNGLYVIEIHDNQSFAFRNFIHDDLNKNSISQGTILSLQADQKQVLWIGTENGGLNRLELNQIDRNPIFHKHYYDATNVNSISSNSIYAIFQDNRNDMWLGTYVGGINLYNSDGRRFKNYKHIPLKDNSLINQTVNVIKKIDNELFIGTEGGLSVLNLENTRYKHYTYQENNPNTLGSNAVWAILPESREKIWVGTWAGGLNILNHETGNVQRIRHDQDDSLSIPSNNIFYLYKDRDGDFWVATMGGGLALMDEETGYFKRFQYSPDQNSISSNWVRQVYQNSLNEIWISTMDGVDIYNKETGVFTNFVHNKDDSTSISGNGAYAIFEDSNGTMWLGTEVGLNYFIRDDSTFSAYLLEDGLPNNSIKSIQEDGHGNLWVGTNNGISKFVNAINLPSDPEFVNFDVSDGLQSNEFNRRASFKDNHGMMYFGGIDGLSYFNPDSIRKNTVPPPIVLTELQVMNHPVDIESPDAPVNSHISVADKITLTHKQSIFTIQYAALNYIATSKNQYAYKLEGFEQDWNDVGTQRRVTYTNLSPGDYIFKVKASNNDNVWNNNPRELQITVLPPWWKTNWAFLMYIILLLLSIYAFILLSQMRFREREKLKLERKQHEQETALTQQKLQFFTNISHEFRTPLTLIYSPLEDILKNHIHQLTYDLKKRLHTIYKNALRLNRLSTELMDFRKLQFNKLKMSISQQDICEFTNNVTGLFNEEAHLQHISLQINVPEKPVFLWFDQSMIEKVLFNLLSNAFKVTPEYGSVDVHVREEQDNMNPSDKWICIDVTDTGPGLSEDQFGKIFERFYQGDNENKTYYSSTGIGLSLAKSLVEKHGGDITVNSELGKGSTFKVWLRKGHDHFSDEDLKKAPKEVLKSELNPLPDFVLEDKMNNNNHLPNDLSVLLIEDHKELRKYLVEELTPQYKIYEAPNGKKGIELARKHLPDVIVSDVLMPEVDGFELSRAIREDESISHIPIILLTARSTIEDQIEGTDAGADAYIIKPFNPRLLRSKIDQLIHSRQKLFHKFSVDLKLIPDLDAYTNFDKDFLTKVSNFIIQNIGNSDLSVEEIGKEIHLSRSQLYRKIKSLSGHSVNEFIRIIRLEQARKLILQGKMSIHEIGYEVGFTTPSYFSKCYKEHFGKLPSEEL